MIFQTDAKGNQTPYTLGTGDTLVFDAWANWSPLEKATLTLEEVGVDNARELTREQDRNRGARFMYVIKAEDVKKEFHVILNYHISGVEPRNFIHFRNGRFE
ncbi:MAG: hypothetical protein AAGI38_05325 [Bacteroidota bacterium]